MRSMLAPALLLLIVGPAAAQPMAPQTNRPTFSPYLNLLRGAGNGSAGPALNYFGLVRPQIEFRQQNTQLQNQLNQTNMAVSGLNSQVQAGTDELLPVTGRGATFMNYSHYYPTLGTGTGSIGGGGGSGIARMAGGGNFNRPAVGGAGGAATGIGRATGAAGGAGAMRGLGGAGGFRR